MLRTNKYRRAGLRFSETPVHNDILGHWSSLLFADQVLLLDRVICTHVVKASGRHLTNRQSRQRLSLFDALDETYSLLEGTPAWREAFAGDYWRFAIRTCNWAGDRISAEYLPEFEGRRREHLLRIDIGDFIRLRMDEDPALAETIVTKALT